MEREWEQLKTLFLSVFFSSLFEFVRVLSQFKLGLISDTNKSNYAMREFSFFYDFFSLVINHLSGRDEICNNLFLYTSQMDEEGFFLSTVLFMKRLRVFIILLFYKRKNIKYGKIILSLQTGSRDSHIFR